jgi:predicted neuraminidase
MDDWTSVPVVRGAGGDVALKAEEPMWWTLPNGNLAAFFRDNSVSHYIYRAFSTDNGRTWSAPVQTDFPDARSKLHGIRLTDGRYVLVSNSNPAKRDPMTIAVSADGLVFTKLFYIVGGRHIDYPQVMQHGDYLYVAHSGAKMSVEIERIRIADLDRPMTASAPH